MNKYGLIIDPIVIDKDWVFGSADSELTIGGAEIQPSGQWLDYLPQGEEQYTPTFDCEACASFGTNNAIEILARRVYGQIDNFSDRFVAKGSGTTPAGNSPHTVAEFIRKNGGIPEADYPFTSDLDTWDKFYSSIPQKLYTLAIAFIAEFVFAHEYVPTYAIALKNALKYSPLGISLYAWEKDSNGLYYQPAGYQNNHWVVLVGYVDTKYWIVWDTYDLEQKGDFLKKVRWDMPFTIAKRYSLTRQVVNNSAFARFISFLRSWLNL